MRAGRPSASPRSRPRSPREPIPDISAWPVAGTPGEATSVWRFGSGRRRGLSSTCCCSKLGPRGRPGRSSGAFSTAGAVYPDRSGAARASGAPGLARAPPARTGKRVGPERTRDGVVRAEPTPSGCVAPASGTVAGVPTARSDCPRGRTPSRTARTRTSRPGRRRAPWPGGAAAGDGPGRPPGSSPARSVEPVPTRDRPGSGPPRASSRRAAGSAGIASPRWRPDLEG